MILSSDQYPSAAVIDLLRAAEAGHVAIDRRFIRAILERVDETVAAILQFLKEDHENARLGIEGDLLAILRQMHTPAALPALAELARRTGFDMPEELTEAFVELGADSIDALLELYQESEGEGDVAFALASLRVHDPRVLDVLLEAMERDPLEGSLSLAAYGDPAARPALEKALAQAGPEDEYLRREVAKAIEDLNRPHPAEPLPPFELWNAYPEEGEPFFDLLQPAELVSFLGSPVAGYRAGALGVLGYAGVEGETAVRILEMAKSDSDTGVRAAGWEALDGTLDEPGVREAVTARVEDAGAPIEERAAALVTLAAEAHESEPIFQRILEFYDIPGARAQALKAMWHSMDRRFADYLPRHLDDADSEIRRQAIVGMGWLGVTSQIGRLVPFFENEDLRHAALYSYALAAPSDTSPAHLRRLLRKIEDLAGGFNDEDDQLVRRALDDRLQAHGLEPQFLEPEPTEEPEEAPAPAPLPVKVGRNDPCPCGSGKKYKRCCGV